EAWRRPAHHPCGRWSNASRRNSRTSCRRSRFVRGLRGTELIFPRRRWATRIIEKAGFPIRSREATVLIDLLIWASKRNQQGLPIAEQALIPPFRMAYNQSAIAKVPEELASPS